LSTDPQTLLATLIEARTECMRAVEALEQVRSTAHAIGNHVLGDHATDTTGDLL
jgi:hypothetical protein